jgi:regulatory protein
VKLPRSLKARALQWLAQREHSRVELRRKLLPHAMAEDELATASGAAPAEPAPAARVEVVLDWLESHAYLSPERFVESRVHARSARFGNLRIRHELKQHQLALPAETAQALQDSELQRACAVRARKFARVPVTAAERARQARFLAGRGFSPDVIARALRTAAAVDDDEPDAVDRTSR